MDNWPEALAGLAVDWNLAIVKNRKTMNRRPILEADNSGRLGHKSPFHEISRKINYVLVQWLCQTTASQFPNPNDTRDILFCHCFSYMLKSQSSAGLQQGKSIPEADSTGCSAEFSRMRLGAVCQQNHLVITQLQF